MTTIKKVKDAEQIGEYKPTEIDRIKAEVDFRLLQVNPYVVRWKDGSTETLNASKLKKLKENHSWMCDF